MKNSWIILLLCIFTTTSSIAKKRDNASTVATEETGNADLLRITEINNKTRPVPINNGTPVVDINSNIDITIQKRQLTSTIATSVDYDKSISDQLVIINKILEFQKAILQSLQPQVANVASGQKPNYDILMRDFIELIKKYPDIQDRINDFFNEAISKRIREGIQVYVMQQTAVYADSIINNIQTSDKLKSVSIKLVATLSTKGESARKVHVQNFDNYSEGEYYEVPRWVTTFSEEDIKKFNDMDQLTRQMNTVINDGFSGVKKVLSQNLTSIECFKGLKTEVENTLSNPDASFAAEIDIVKNYLSQFETELAILNNDLSILSNGSTDVTKNALQSFNTASEQLLSMVKTAPDNMKRLKTSLPAALQTNAKLNELQGTFNTCIEKLRADSLTIANSVTLVKQFFLAFQTSDKADDISGNSTAYTIDQIPVYGSINLKTIGKRNNGDELTIKLVCQTKADVEANRPGTVVTQYYIQLQQIRFYSVANVSAIAVHALGNTDSLRIKNNIQFAPAGSLLLKFGSRKSQLWNDISPGIGITLSTPDFDLDGAPDVSYGGVITFFKDVVSTGFAYNTKTKTPFWFFGASLPFTSLGLTGKVETK